MNGENEELEEHKFGIGDYLSADDYAENEEVRAKVLGFLGRQSYTGKDGKQKRAGMFRVNACGVPQEFRLGIKNEKVAAKMGIDGYEKLVDKTLLLKVKKFQLGNGFVLIGIQEVEGISRTGVSYTARRTAPDGMISEAQMGLIRKLSAASKEPLSKILAEDYRDPKTLAPRSVDDLSKEESSRLIDKLRSLQTKSD